MDFWIHKNSARAHVMLALFQILVYMYVLDPQVIIFLKQSKENLILFSVWLPWHMPVAWGSSHCWANCDCLSENQPSLHLPVFRELLIENLI